MFMDLTGSLEVPGEVHQVWFCVILSVRLSLLAAADIRTLFHPAMYSRLSEEAFYKTLMLCAFASLRGVVSEECAST